MRTIKIILLVIFSLYSSLMSGETTKVGTTAAQFLKIGVGSRAVAMGESFVAVANDASSIFWNPAGLAALKSNEVLLSHSDWIADISFDFAGVAIATESMGTFALYAVGLSMDEMERRTEYEQDGTGEKFDASDIALGVSYARYFTERFSFGMNAKYIEQRIWKESASTIAIDVGIIYHTELKNLSLGMALSNFGGKMQMEGKDLLRFIDIDPNLEGNNEQIISRLNTEKFDLPLAFRIGVAYKVLDNEFQSLLLAVDGLSPNDYNEYVNTGFEYGLRDMVFLRGGYKGLGVPEQEVGFSLGGGVKYSFDQALGLKIDYAYTDFGRLENAQRISLSVNF